MRILVTGAGGFSGRHLIQYLAGVPSTEIYCTSATPRTEKHWLFCDLAQKRAASKLIEQIMPHQIYHLAGLNSDDYRANYRVNVLSTRNILETIARTRSPCRVLLIGSSAEYGLVPETDNPVSEEHPLSPLSVYGLTKVYQTYLMKFYSSVYNMDIVMARPFNLLGSNAPVNLFVGRVYQQVEAFRAGDISRILVGNLQNRRDYIPVERAVRYYALIMNRGKSGEIYNVASGRSICIRDLLERILNENGLSMAIVDEQEPADRNKVDIRDLVGDIRKLMALTDGQPAVDD
jgi:GDP-4-dehydro-6-deoxy-D-mannose reductase